MEERIKIFNELTFKDRQELVKEICGGCTKLGRSKKTKELVCIAYNEFYFLWGKFSECPARTDVVWKQARDSFSEDEHRVLSKGSRGEKSDRTHKLFGKERMKDNRTRWKWNEL